MSSARSGQARGVTGLWIGLGVLLLVQWGLFRQFAEREVVWGYPTNFDQVAYLQLAYQTYERILADGPARGLWWGFVRPQASGLMLHLQAAVLFLLTGPSRLAALAMNFAYFAVFEVALVWTLLWLTGRRAVALFGLGLLLAAATPFHYAGGFMDFRIDSIAFSLFGTFLCLAIRSGVFASRPLSWIASASAVLLVLFRFIALAYLLGIFVLLAARLALRLRQRTDPDESARIAARLRGLGRVAAVVLVCAAPVVAVKLPAIRNYYVVGHLTGSEKTIRAQEVGAFRLHDHLLFYPRSVIVDHAGLAFVWLAVGALVASAGMAWHRRSRGGDLQSSDTRYCYDLVAACIVAPLAILTLNVAKSYVVGSILVPPLLWLVLLVLIRSGGFDRPSPPPVLVTRTMTVLGAAGLATGLYYHASQFSRHGLLAPQRADVQQIVGLFESIGEHSQRMGWSAPRLSFDHSDDYFFAPILGPLMYERRGVLMWGWARLGGGILAVTERQARALMEDSDFLVVSEGSLPNPSAYPFNRTAQAMRSSLRQFGEEHFVPLGVFRIFGHDRRLYVRPALRVTGDSGGWITSDGLTLTAPTLILRSRPTVALRGRSEFAWLRGVPRVKAELSGPKQPSRPVATTMLTAGSDYCIKLDLKPEFTHPHDEASVRLTFDSYFVPRDIGLNADTRRLVIQTPQRVSLHRQDDDDVCRLTPPARAVPAEPHP